MDSSFSSDSDDDSGYCSEDEDDNAEHWDTLLERFRAEGPTLANHGENTKKMEREQEKKWNE